MKKYEKIFEKFHRKKTAVFIDEGNVFYSQKKLGWHIHWKKFLDFLTSFVEIKSANYYMGMPISKNNSYEKNILIKDRLQREGLNVITKPLKKIFLNKEKDDFIYKCNFDVEITKDVLNALPEADIFVVVSGDSDFIGLRNEVLKRGKNFIFVCFEDNVSWEIRRSFHIFFEDIKDFIEYKSGK